MRVSLSIYSEKVGEGNCRVVAVPPIEPAVGHVPLLRKPLHPGRNVTARDLIRLSVPRRP